MTYRTHRRIALALLITSMVVIGCEEKKTATSPAPRTAQQTTEEAPDRGADSTSPTDEAQPDAAAPDATGEADAKPKSSTYRRVELEEIRRDAADAVVHHTRESPDSLRSAVIAGLGHPAFEGPVGPFEKAYFYIADFELDTPDLDLWVMAEREGEWHAWGVRYNNWMVQTVDAVFFEDIGGDGNVEAIVIYTYMPGVGMEAAHEFTVAFVVEWDEEGREFRVNRDIFRGRELVANAAEARQILREEGLLPSD